MKQTVLIQVSMDGQRNCFCITEGEKAHRKAMKIAVGFPGVESSALKGQNRDQIEAKGDNIDTVKLATLLRKKVGHASIVRVAEEKKEDKKKKKMNRRYSALMDPPTHSMRLEAPVMTQMFAPSCNFVSTSGNNHQEGESLNS